VTLEAICHTSSTLDPEGRGVKKSAILENADAHAYYRKHSTSYQTMKQRDRKPRGKPASSSLQSLHIDPNRNMDRARHRYVQMTKAELVERLLTVEQAYADVQQQFAQLQFQFLEQEQYQAEQQRQEKRNHKQK